jgi:hypothetical protein
MNTDRTQTAAERMAQAMGINLASANIVDNSWAMKFLDGGVTVKLKIGRWQGMTKLRPEDLGIKLSDDPKKAKEQRQYLALGDKMLLPPSIIDRLNVVEVMGRKNLTGWAIDDKSFGYFMTATAWRMFKTRHDELRERYFEIRDEIIANYDDLKAEVREKYVAFGQDAWRRLRRQGPNVPVPEEWVEAYVTRVMARFPTKEYIANSFYYEAVPTIVPLYAMVNQGTGIEGEELEIRREVANYWRERQKEAIDDFLAESVVKLRGEAFAAIRNAQRVAERNSKVGTKTIKALGATIDTILAIDPYGDTELATMFNTLKTKMAGGDEKSVDQAELISAINDLSTVLQVSIMAAGAIERGAVSSKDLEDMPELPSVGMITASRTALGLDTIEVPTVVQSVYRFDDMTVNEL